MVAVLIGLIVCLLYFSLSALKWRKTPTYLTYRALLLYLRKVLFTFGELLYLSFLRYLNLSNVSKFIYFRVLSISNFSLAQEIGESLQSVPPYSTLSTYILHYKRFSLMKLYLIHPLLSQIYHLPSKSLLNSIANLRGILPASTPSPCSEELGVRCISHALFRMGRLNTMLAWKTAWTWGTTYQYELLFGLLTMVGTL